MLSRVKNRAANIIGKWHEEKSKVEPDKEYPYDDSPAKAIAVSAINPIKDKNKTPVLPNVKPAIKTTGGNNNILDLSLKPVVAPKKLPLMPETIPTNEKQPPSGKTANTNPVDDLLQKLNSADFECIRYYNNILVIYSPEQKAAFEKIVPPKAYTFSEKGHLKTNNRACWWIKIEKYEYHLRKNDIAILKEFLSFPLSSADAVFKKFSVLKGANIYTGNSAGERFLFISGTRSDALTLVAHADTVFTGTQKIVEKIIDKKACFVGENHEVGIGADDRAGCAILWLLKDLGHNILITDYEEKCFVGTHFLVKNHKTILEKINKSPFMLEFDRKNSTTFRCYNIPVTQEFHQFINNEFGYSHDPIGGHTDICEFCIPGGCCSTNISVGYYNAHSAEEYIIIDAWLNTLNKARKLLSKKSFPNFRLK